MKKHEQYQSIRISDLSQTDVESFIEEEIFQLWNDFGQKVDVEQISHICRRLYGVLTTKYRSWYVGTIHAIFQSGLNGSFGVNHKVTVKTLFFWLNASQQQLTNIRADKAEEESERNKNWKPFIDSLETEFLVWATKNQICLNYVDPDHEPLVSKKVSPKIIELAQEYQQAKDMDLLIPFMHRIKDQSIEYNEKIN